MSQLVSIDDLMTALDGGQEEPILRVDQYFGPKSDRHPTIMHSEAKFWSSYCVCMFGRVRVTEGPIKKVHLEGIKASRVVFIVHQVIGFDEGARRVECLPEEKPSIRLQHGVVCQEVRARCVAQDEGTRQLAAVQDDDRPVAIGNEDVRRIQEADREDAR